MLRVLAAMYRASDGADGDNVARREGPLEVRGGASPHELRHFLGRRGIGDTSAVVRACRGPVRTGRSLVSWSEGSGYPAWPWRGCAARVTLRLIRGTSNHAYPRQVLEILVRLCRRRRVGDCGGRRDRSGDWRVPAPYRRG